MFCFKTNLIQIFNFLDYLKFLNKKQSTKRTKFINCYLLFAQKSNKKEKLLTTN